MLKKIAILLTIYTSTLLSGCMSDTYYDTTSGQYMNSQQFQKAHPELKDGVETYDY